jgi:hypothetical protein
MTNMTRLLEQQGQQQSASDTRLMRLEELITGISHQQNTLLQKLQESARESSTNREQLHISQEGLA